MNYYNIENKLIELDISSQLLKHFGKEPPIIVCLGSSKVLADMVGVFVADELRKQGVKTIVFGGEKRNVTNSMAKILAKSVDKSRLLFVDSGVLKNDNSIMIAESLTMNDGHKIDAFSIVAGTIFVENNKLNFAKKEFREIKNFAKIITNSVLSYFSYLEILK